MVFVSGLTLQNSPLAQWKGNPIGPLGEPIIKNRCFLEWETSQNHPKRGGFNKRKISGLRTPSLINNQPLAVLVSNAPSNWRKQTDIVVFWRAQMFDWFAFIWFYTYRRIIRQYPMVFPCHALFSVENDYHSFSWCSPRFWLMHTHTIICWETLNVAPHSSPWLIGNTHSSKTFPPNHELVDTNSPSMDCDSSQLILVGTIPQLIN